MRVKSFSIFLFLLIIFSCNDSESEYGRDFEEIDRLITEMVSQGQELSDALDTIAHQYIDHINRYDSLRETADFSKYTFTRAYSTNLPGEDSALSSVMILNTTPDRDRALEEAAATNFLDSLFSRFQKSFPLVVQVYSNSANQVSRVYPAFDHKNIVEPNLDVKDFNFYYAADEINNPSKGIVWIQDAYIDPAGKGWILSLIHPVYQGEKLFAVLGADFTVDDFIYEYFDRYPGDYLLVNGKGDIIGGEDGAIELLSMPALKNHVYRETVKSESFRISDFNLFNSKSLEVRKMAQEFLLNKKDRFEFEEEKGINKAICKMVPGIDWYLIQIFPEQ
ncbi:hypothetical protein DFQ04_0462 [Algoriphagus boseongensis]|uniref:Cache domain-containing protein n=1 Tax=Algoriphagus boseongensis TaxID=1442587 RepID=A0A4V3D2F1_9BACT|nr:hypothetical protein [Algoriphagus boseongensis]TDQ18657.1 hypothetical protein DFQ04_0462 [Algoriphagus boseongensis]